MKYIFIITLLSIVYKHSAHKSSVIQSKDIHQFKSIDTSRYAIFIFDKNRDSYYFDKDVKPAYLSDVELLKIDSTINNQASQYHVNGINSIIKEPEKYYKQVIAVSNLSAEKEVWINCFCPDYKISDWRAKLFLVLDGGACFFSLKINLTKNTVYYFRVHGEP